MKISFIVPFHNEEKSVSIVLDRIIQIAKSHKWNVEIIPINDKSSDLTPNIINRYAKKYPVIKALHRMRLSNNTGNTMGEALREATSKATGDLVIWTMGDCSDDPLTYSKIVKKLTDGYDMVFASRYMKGGSKGNLDTLKAFLSQWGTVLAKVLFQIPVNDITNAFRGFRKQVFIVTNPRSSDFAISPEFAIRAQICGFKLGQVPTTYHNRVEGISNFKLYNMTLSYLSIYINLFIHHRLLNKPLDQ